MIGESKHAVWHETGGGGANAGVQFTEIGAGGRFTVDEFVGAVKPRNHMSNKKAGAAKTAPKLAVAEPAQKAS